MKNVCCAAALAAALAGCATPAPEKWKSSDPTTQHLLDQAVAQCEYEIALAVREPSAVSKSSLLADYDVSLQRKKMMKPCLKAKGWG